MPKNQPLIVNIRPWSEADLPLLERLIGDPAKAGTGALDQARTRHERYLRSGETSRQGPMFAITVGVKAEPVGSIGYWQRVWQGQHLWEIGWSVLPEFQGQGIANQAIKLVADRARSLGRFRFLHAFPAVDNEAANAICQAAGFELLGQVEFSLPARHTMRRNDWRLELIPGIG
jgi:RimJ/RimL family protein N-acetyltransferase